MTPTLLAPTLPTGLRRLATVCLTALPLLGVAATPALSQVPAVKPLARASALSLEPASGSTINAELSPVTGRPRATPPANFHRMPTTHLGELSALETLTIRFSATAKLGKITSTPDFPIEQGSSCVEGNVYESGKTCTLLVRFTPKGAGNRFGRVAIENSASVKPFYVGLGGNGYTPVISFTPAVISTVPSSYPSNKGLLSGASSLAVDGGDTLYVADTGNNVIRSMDSSGAFTTVSSGTLSAPYGVAVDSFGEVFFDEPAKNFIFQIFDYGAQYQINGTGTDSCSTSTPCSIANEAVYAPGQMSIDPYDNIVMVEGNRGAMELIAQPYPSKMARLYNPFTFQTSSQGTLAVDANDNIYSLWNAGVCQIASQYFSDSANGRAVYKKIAGGKTCGFTGDGGQARNAEIGSKVPQFAFDTAGNMYFADSSNQRVRRIDAVTGIINTIAGNGTAGYGGDGGASTFANLANPTGVAVDSQGQVYIISSTSSTATAQVVRKLGPDGAIPFGNQLRNTFSTAHTITLSNTGNAALTFTSYHFTGAAATDYTVDPNTTTCLLTAGSTLAIGQSCKVGVLFHPASAGTRQATLQFFDNTVTNINNVQLYGVGVLPTPTIVFTSPASGASYKSGTAVPVSVTISSGSTPAPTGTVKFTVDGAAYGSPVAVATNGVASISMTGLTTANHTLGAIYSGDTNYSTATVTRAISVTAAAAKTAVAVVAKTVPATTCSSLIYAATVSSSSTPSGTVQLKEGSTLLSTATLTSGAANISTKPLSAGTHTLTTYYAGDATHAPSSVNLTQTITASTTPCSKVVANPLKPVRPRHAVPTTTF